MKHKTINQINGFCANNQTFAFYWQLRKNAWNYTEPQNYRNNYYKFNERTNGSGNFSSCPMSNFIHTACEIELQRFCRHSVGVSSYRREHLKIESKRYDLQIQICLSIDFDGVYIQAITFDKTAYVPSQKFKVRSNETFQSLDILKYFEQKILNKHLFAPGLFREIQLMHNCTKEKAKSLYKDILAQYKMPLSENMIYDFALKSIRRNLRKHYNLLTDGFWSDVELISFRKYGKQKVKTQIESHPNFFDRFTDFDGSIDELENEFYSLYDRENPTIFV